MSDPDSWGPRFPYAPGTFQSVGTAAVGRTVCHRSRNPERALGLGRLYLIFAGGNSTGSQKDRAAFGMVEETLRRGCTAPMAATGGDSRVALAFAAKVPGLSACLFFPFFPQGSHSRRVEEAACLGARVGRGAGDDERRMAVSRAAGHGFEANPGGANTAARLEAFGAIAEEIVESREDAPLPMAIPLRNGTTPAGISAGLARLKEIGRITRPPRRIASSSRKNPIGRSVEQGSLLCLDLSPGRIGQITVNEPLINGHAFRAEALHALCASGGVADDPLDRETIRSVCLLQQAGGLRTLPASAAALTILARVRRTGALSEEGHVVVLTGRRLSPRRGDPCDG